MGTNAKRKEYNGALVSWARGLYGPGKAAKSGLELSRNARRNRNTVGTLERDGTATAEVIIDLARASDVDPLEGLRIGGYLSVGEVGPPTFKVTDQEQEMVEEYRRLPVEGQRWMLGSLQGMRGTAIPSDE